MATVRRFNEFGTRQFKKYFHSRVDGVSSAVPEELLSSTNPKLLNWKVD